MGCKESETTEQLNWTELTLCWGEYSISQMSVHMSQLIDTYQSKLWWSIYHITLTGYLKGSCKATPKQILVHNLSWASSKIALQIVTSKICWVSFFYNSQKQKNSGLKKVGKTTRPFRYDLNQIPYDYTVEVMNRRDFIWQTECLKNCEWRFITLYRRPCTKPSQRKRNAKRQNGCLSFTSSWGKKKSKRQGRKGKILPSECKVRENCSSKKR